MRIQLSTILASTFLATSIVPAIAAPSINHIEHKEQSEAKAAFHHLSDDGQKAMIDILKAQQALIGKDTKATTALLNHASKSLSKADNQNAKFVASMEQINPKKLKKHHHHQVSNDAFAWVPVGGEFMVSEQMTTAKQATVKKANALIKAGHIQEAAATMKVVAEDVDFIVAIAPLEQTQQKIKTALLLLTDQKTNDAAQALTDIVDSVAFVNENTLISYAPNK